MLHFRELVLPILPNLRTSIIHNDANEWNLLVQRGAISGIIDFGDITWAPLINELAIAISYGIMGKDDPVKMGWIYLKILS
jgi:ethanolamine-phosphate phospho-lyase